jgi:hypothetical protein
MKLHKEALALTVGAFLLPKIGHMSRITNLIGSPVGGPFHVLARPESNSNLSCVVGTALFKYKKSAQWRTFSVDYPNGKAVLFLSTRKSLPGLVLFNI